MKKHSWELLVSILAILLLLVACSEQQPAAEEGAEAEQGQEVQETVPEAPEAAEQAEIGEAVEPAVEAPVISQPIYRWGEVADQVWVLVGYDDAVNPIVVEEGTVITAVFSSVDNQMSGSGGCNNYFTTYESTDDGGLTISPNAGMTMMACENLMETESAYIAALDTVTAWSLNENGDLELTYYSGQPYEEKLVYVPGETPLTGTIWQLVTMW